MRKSSNKIGWCQKTVNPIKGLCPNVDCEIYDECYGRGLYKRYNYDPKIRLKLSVFDELKNYEPLTIFCGSTIEMFAQGIPDNFIVKTLRKIEEYQQHTFIILTKKPERAVLYRYPKNVILGVSITSYRYIDRLLKLQENKEVRKCISFEPLLDIPFKQLPDLSDISIAFIGALTHAGKPIKKHYPKLEWVQMILDVANKCNVNIWMKENLLLQEKLRN